MKIKAGVNLHNRFDIVKNGEWVGYAENIILDQMYSRICNLSTYFANIHFGTGSGTPTPDRTSLFSHLGTKTAADEELVKALPTSKWTRKITVNPEEYVGQTITEVGIASGSAASNLVTHAMIKDAEGNPLSINKTDIDVIVIYATVFVTFLTPSSNFVYCSMPNNNSIVNYFIGTSGHIRSANLAIGSCDKELPNTVSMGSVVAFNSASQTADVPQRKTIFSTRFAIEQGNEGKKISELGLIDASTSLDYNRNFLRVLLPDTGVFESFNFQDVVVGSGDGQETEFLLPIGEIDDLEVKVDGIPVSNYSYTRNKLPEHRYTFFDIVDITREIPSSMDYKVFYGDISSLTTSSTIRFEFPIRTSLEGYRLHAILNSPSYSGGVRLHARTEEGSWVFMDFVGPTSANYPYGETITDDTIYDWAMVELFPHSSTYSQKFYYVGLNRPNDENKIVFSVPPAQESIIEISGTTTHLPKDENYVIDVTFELQFGEGAIL